MDKVVTWFRDRLVEASTHAGLAAIWGSLAAQFTGTASKFSLVAGAVHAALAMMLKGGDGGNK